MNETLRLHQGPPFADNEPATIRYIRLGSGRDMARACIQEGFIGVAFERIPHQTCVDRDWRRVRQIFIDEGKTPRTASSHCRELQDFYDLAAETLWATVADGRLWWAFAEPDVTWSDAHLGHLLRRRKTIGPWRCTDANGAPLLTKALSPRFTQVASFRQTLCNVREGDYLRRRLNATPTKTIENAIAARAKAVEAALALIKDSYPPDFELLVDLIFAASGWRRVSVLGGNEADVDLVVEQIATGERAFVQVKSKATPAILADYVKRFQAHGRYDRMFFVCHSPSPELGVMTGPAGISLWLGESIAHKAVRAGLLDWLIARAR